MVKVVPTPISLWTPTRPPWASATYLTIDRPRPLPPAARVRVVPVPADASSPDPTRALPAEQRVARLEHLAMSRHALVI